MRVVSRMRGNPAPPNGVDQDDLEMRTMISHQSNLQAWDHDDEKKGQVEPSYQEPDNR